MTRKHRFHCSGVFATCLLLILLGTAARSFGQYQFTTLNDPLGNSGTWAYAISGSNVVGYYEETGNDTASQNGFIYNTVTHAYKTLTAAGTQNTVLSGISGANIVGYNSNGGFIYNGSGYTYLGAPAGEQIGAPCGVYGSKVVGYYYDSLDTPHGYVLSGGAYTRTEPAGTDGNAAEGVYGNSIVGWYSNTKGRFGYYYNGTKYTTVSPPLASEANGGTTAYGIYGTDIVGSYFDANRFINGFLLSGTTYKVVDSPLGAYGTVPIGIDGTNITGFYTDVDGLTHGFLATPMQPLYTAILSATSRATTIPQAPGWATLTIGPTDGVTMSGGLPGGGTFIAEGYLQGVDGNQFVINISLAYLDPKTKGALGSLSGTITFAKTALNDFTGTLKWVKPAQTAGYYTAAINTNLNVVGSVYVDAAGKSVLPGFTTGTLDFTDSGKLSPTGTTHLNQAVKLTTANVLETTAPVQDKVTLALTAATGVFKGTFVYPGTTTPIPYAGILFQDQTKAIGEFQGPHGSGTVSLVK